MTFPLPQSEFWPLPVVHPWTLESIGIPLTRVGLVSMNEASSGTWPTSNFAIFVPFKLYVSQLAQKIIVMNGATVSGNLDAGIYGERGTLIVSKGSTAQAGTDTIQELDITDTLLSPGLYYMALVLDNTTGTTFRLGAGTTTFGLLNQTSAFPLPNLSTFAAATSVNVPLFGVCFKSLI